MTHLSFRDQPPGLKSKGLCLVWPVGLAAGGKERGASPNLGPCLGEGSRFQSILVMLQNRFDSSRSRADFLFKHITLQLKLRPHDFYTVAASQNRLRFCENFSAEHSLLGPTRRKRNEALGPGCFL